MISVELSIGSEIANLLNFLIFDIILIAIIMHLTSRLAGLHNHLHVSSIDEISLRPCSLPHIGGGIVMKTGPTRLFLIFLRLSALAAIFISNFGLQGRSKTPLVPKQVTVRQPGPFVDLSTDGLFNATEIRMRCASAVGEELHFESVLDGVCYPAMVSEVYVNTIALGFEEITTTLTNCEENPILDRYYSVIRCNDVDLVCSGPFPNGAGGIQIHQCDSVVYEEDVAWICPKDELNYTLNSPMVASCRRIGAKKKDIELWTQIFRFKTEDVLVAIFGSAYGREAQIQTAVPGEEMSITIVTLWWIIPTAWMVAVVVTSTGWFSFLWWHGARPIANDEWSLMRMLQGTSSPGFDVTSDGLEVEWY